MNLHQPLTLQDMKPGQHFMVATEGMRGHFACEMWMNNKDNPDTVFPEPWQSDPHSFATKQEAADYAMTLAQMEGLPYVE